MSRRRRVVVVDDDSAVLHTVRRQLETLDWDVYPAATADEALSILRALEQVDALLTDVDMPRMDGVALQREVADHFPGMAVVLMSGGLERPSSPAAGLSTSALLHKPFTLQALAAALDAALMPTNGRQE
jgi:CheY-like chemotaxis protein